MSRSLKKELYTWRTLRLLKKIAENKKKYPTINKAINTWFRSSIITPEMIGSTFGIHNGQKFVLREVRAEMVGYKLGEFVPTSHQRRKHGKAGKH